MGASGACLGNRRGRRRGRVGAAPPRDRRDCRGVDPSEYPGRRPALAGRCLRAPGCGGRYRVRRGAAARQRRRGRGVQAVAASGRRPRLVRAGGLGRAAPARRPTPNAVRDRAAHGSGHLLVPLAPGRGARRHPGGDGVRPGSRWSASSVGARLRGRPLAGLRGSSCGPPRRLSGRCAVRRSPRVPRCRGGVRGVRPGRHLPRPVLPRREVRTP
jgi:hypothetical protein